MDPVTLIAPDGSQYVTSDPVEANNLQFGHGYRPAPAEEPTAVPEQEQPAPRPTTRGRRADSDREQPTAE